MTRLANLRPIMLVAALLALMACEAEQEAKSATAGAGAARAAEPVDGKRLAISHAFTLRLPSKEVEAAQQKHLTECGKLGCTVLNTRLDRSNEGRIHAWTSIRIAPKAYTTFAATIATPPAKVITHAESAEDKTLPLLDVEKRLEVKAVLRDRLTAMLREPGKKSVSDLAALEKELAQVQGDIEAAIAQHDYLLTVTETVKVDITYTGMAAQAGGFDLSPIDRAIKGIGRTVVNSVAALISFIAAVVPWLPLIALLIWGIRRCVRRWRARRAG